MAATPGRKHFMTATWHHDDPSTWNFHQHLIMKLNLLQNPSGSPAPPQPTGKVPVHHVWKQHAWVFPRAVAPLILHWAFMKATGWTLHPVAAFFYYAIALKTFAILSVHKFNKMGKEYGFFDGKVPRDGVPDGRIAEVARSLIGTITIRPMFACFIAYNRYELPSLSWWFPVQLFAYACILDFYFYWYHRAMHEVSWLWKYHRVHHLTRHPNPLLSAFADHEQEWCDILVVPLLTWLTYRVNFATWWMCTVYILYTEAMGHSGIRMYWQTPATGPVLRLFDADLCLEDHDLHHRQGWKVSANYGKQTRLWDKIFGSTRNRIECTEDNIEW